MSYLLSRFFPDPFIISLVLIPPCLLFSYPETPRLHPSLVTLIYPLEHGPEWTHVCHLLSPSLFLYHLAIPCLFMCVVWHVAEVGGIIQPVQSPLTSRRDLPKERALHMMRTSHLKIDTDVWQDKILKVLQNVHETRPSTHVLACSFIHSSSQYLLTYVCQTLL